MTKVNSGKYVSLEKYVKDTVEKIRQYTDRKIVVRSIQMPLKNMSVLDNVGYEIPKQIKNTYDDFDQILPNAWAVISPSSNWIPCCIEWNTCFCQ